MFKCAANILEIASVQVCRLCLVEEEDLVYLFNPKGYQGFQLWKLIEELLQEELSKEDGMPWTVCKGCVSKLKEFKHFKSTCIQSKISFLSMMVNRGSEFIIKDEDNADESLSEAETHNQDILPMDDSSCMGVSNDASLANPLNLIYIKEDADAVESCSEAGTCNQKNHQEYAQLSTVVCFPLVKEELFWDKEEVDPRESLAREETHGGENLAEDQTQVTSISHRISEPQLMENMALIDTEDIESTRSPELQDDEEEYDYRLILDSSSEDENADNVQSCGAKEEDDSGSQSLTRVEAQGVEALPEDDSRLTSVSRVVIVPSLFGNVMNVKDEMETDKSLSDTETCGKENLFRNEFTCTGVSSDAALSDPLDLTGVKEDADDGGLLLKAVTCNQENVQHIHSLDVGYLNVVCLPLEMGECPTEEEENEPRESLAGEETHEGDNLVEEYSRLTSVTNVVSVPQAVNDMLYVKEEVHAPESLSEAETHDQDFFHKVESACMGVSNDASLADPLELLDIKDDADVSETCSEAENQENHQEYASLDAQVSNVFCLPLIQEKLSCLAPRTPSQSSLELTMTTSKGASSHTSRKNYNEVEVVEIVKEKTPCVSADKDPPQEVTVSRQERNRGHGEKADGCSVPGGSTKMCEEIASELRDDRNKNITKKFERNTSLCALTGEHSLSTAKIFSAKKGESLKLRDCITSTLKLNDMIPSERRHLDSHKKQLEGCTAFICDQCGESYTDKKKLFIHVGGHISRNRPSMSAMLEDSSPKCIQSRVTGSQKSKQFKCEMCEKEFKLKKCLKRHYVVHSNLRPFKCETCGNDFKRKKNLHRHSKIHLDSKLFQCDCCGKRFTSMSALARHLVIHSIVRPFKCDTCGKGFPRKSDLNTHSVMHSSLRPFKCETCGKGFAWKSHLDTHSVMHSGLRPFKCDTCGKGFKRKNDLCNHLVTHSGLRPFRCDTCGRGFIYKSNLDAHAVVHSSLRPFKCEICGKEYKWRILLQRHSIIHS